MYSQVLSSLTISAAPHLGSDGNGAGGLLQTGSRFDNMVAGGVSQVNWNIPAYYQCNKNLLSTANATGMPHANRKPPCEKKWTR